MDMDRPSREGELIAVVRELVRELAPQRLKRGDVTLASRLDRDLGIDSLARTELVLRIERSFRVRLPVTEVAEMDSVADLLKALEHAAPGGITAHAPDVAVHAATPLIGQPDHAKTLTEMLDWHVAEHPDHIHVTVLEDENTVLGTMSYRDLQTAARAVAQGLISRDIGHREPHVEFALDAQHQFGAPERVDAEVAVEPACEGHVAALQPLRAQLAHQFAHDRDQFKLARRHVHS